MREHSLSCRGAGLVRGSGVFMEHESYTLLLPIPRERLFPSWSKMADPCFRKQIGGWGDGLQRASSSFLSRKVPEAATPHFRAWA